MDKKIIFKGGGFFIGLPARDMTLDEWRSYPAKVKEAAIKAGLYQIVTDHEVKTDE